LRQNILGWWCCDTEISSLETWQRAFTKWTMASPLRLREPVKMRSTATTTL
jgi:hypothetical protein